MARGGASARGLAVVERRVDRIEKALKVGKKPEDANEYEALKKVKLPSNRSGRPARPGSARPRAIAGGFQLLSARPWIVVVNVDDAALKLGEDVVCDPIRRRLPEPTPPVIALSAKTEAELVALPKRTRPSSWLTSASRSPDSRG